MSLPSGQGVKFPVDFFAKHRLLEDVDELGYVLQREAAIAACEVKRQSALNTFAQG